ncbi:UNVERIFIED_CONTAM: hypothetical protein FKN15_073144 [Acipenser sinensis]
MVSILDYSISADDDLFVESLEPRSTQPVQTALPRPTTRQLRSAAFTTPNFSAQMSASPVCRGSRLATRSSATPDIRDWTISQLQLYLRSNNVPFKSTARAMTSAQIIALQLAPSVAKSHDKTSPTHVRMGVSINSNAHSAVPEHSGSNYNLSGYLPSLQASSRPLQ